MKKIRILIFMFLLLFPNSVFATEYSVTNYYVSVNVNENNVYDITENYNIIFFENSSFKRKISLRPKVYLTDGKYISYITEVNNMNAKDSTKTSKNSKYYEVSFPENGANKSKSYDLKYSYNMGEDLDSRNDIIFFNINDGSNEVISESISFLVTVPTEISKEDIKFLKDGKEISNPMELTYQLLDKNTVQGTINTPISKDTIYSIQIKLPNGYFGNVSRTSSMANILLLIIPIIAFAVSIYLTKKYKHEKLQISENILSLPNEFDSAEMAYLYKGEIKAKDLFTLVVKLANDGYISIKNFTSHFKIKKEKEYDKDNAAQKIIFDGLFQNKSEIDIKDVEGVFYPYYTDACRTLQNRKNNLRLFYQLVTKSKKMLLLVIYLGFSFLHIKPLYNLLDSYVFATVIGLGLSFLFTLVYKQKNKYLKYSMLGLLAVIFIVECYLLLDFKLNLVIYIIGIILLEIGLYMEDTIPVRTIYGAQKYNEIDLFRLELTGMSDQTFEEKTKENPNYFYEMIPYVLIFGINGWWFNKFSSKVESPPKWYESSEKFDHEKLNEFLEKEIVKKLSISSQATKIYADELLHQAPNKKL